MKRSELFLIKPGFLLILFTIVLPSCDKEEMVIPDKETLDTTFIIDPDDFIVPADSTTLSKLDSSLNLGYTYTRMFTISGQIQKSLAGSLSTMNKAAEKFDETSSKKEEQKEKMPFFHKFWENFTKLLS
jgi:hypothetical protein